MYSFCATEYFSEDDKTVDNLYLQSEQDTKELQYITPQSKRSTTETHFLC